MNKMALFLCFLFCLIISSVTACDRCVHQSQAAQFYQPRLNGECDYRSVASDLTHGFLAAGGESLYKNGAGCGACFQVRCKNKTLCSREGTKVVLTDLYKDEQIDLVLSKKAFMAMAKRGLGQQVSDLGIVDIEYKWIPCAYKNHNLTVRIEETSKNPDYLALKFLYQGGQTQILTVSVFQVSSFQSRSSSLGRSHGAVWETSLSAAPPGPLEFKISLMGGFDALWISSTNPIPADWKPGMTYDLGVQIDAIQKEACSPCDDGTWPTFNDVDQAVSVPPSHIRLPAH